MKVSELIDKLQQHFTEMGDNEVEVILSLGKDKEGVSRVKSAADISVVTGWVNMAGSDKISGVVLMIRG